MNARDPKRITNMREFNAWLQEERERLEREQQERVAAWEHLRSDEYRQQITNEILGEVSDGPPPWED